MKRSGINPGTSVLARAGRLNLVSQKRKKVNAQRTKVVADIRKTRRYCEGQPLLRVAAHAATGKDQAKYIAALQACRPWDPQEPHEPLKRSRGGSLVDPEGIQLLCSPCHRFSEAEVRLSQSAGLLIPSRPVDRILWRRHA